MKSPDKHNREMQNRVEQRLREIENMMNIEKVPFYETRKHQPENTQKPWLRKVIFGAKLFGLFVLTVVAIRIASALVSIVIFGALAFLMYKLFLESKFKNIK
ncbi:MAG: hypothetical protein EAZ76_16710 [Nostocales cyanobacterium]|nr:MAG: hypothetical protein EAZ87_06375 [Nostocales cyanobacterium]TAF08700.1 MAG: hypothetical protein EAZ76_16710 [Nostocales cyanobacterium]